LISWKKALVLGGTGLIVRPVIGSLIRALIEPSYRAGVVRENLIKSATKSISIYL
jgi:hypothetical protein